MEATMNANDTSLDSKKYPPQIKYIVGNEACERYSYYGMRSILVVFMIQYLLFTEAEATSLYHLFAGACYLFPVLGGYISDRFLGKYKTILYLSIVYCLGHLVLALFETKAGMYWGLALIALGSGGIKPCVSAHVGDQFKANQAELLRKVFELFYFMINFGSFFSTLITPWTLKNYGPGWAFGIPGILMLVATIMFWMGRNYYVHVPPSGKNPHGTLSILMSAFKNQSKRKEGESFLDAAKYDGHGQEHVDAVKAAMNVGKTFTMVTFFWALFDQHGSTWVIQATQMDLNFMGMQLEASQIAALNPIMVMALIPFFSMWLYPTMEKMGFNISPLRKMTIGMFTAAFAFIFVAVLQHFIDGGMKLNVMWQFFPYLIITMAEVFISITGLEFAYTQAPRSMKSTIMSMWLLTVFFGNMFTAYVAKINIFTGAAQFYFFAAVMGIFALAFAFIAKGYKQQTFMEK
jgi:POT family proton-dependent oligopeptide transporter